VIIAWRKWILGPIDCEPGEPHKDAYGCDDNTTRMARFNSYVRDMMNMAALVVGSILAAEFNIKVVFPRKADEENWKFITHVREGLSSSDVFGIAIVGFFFLAWMTKQMLYRLETDKPNCADDVHTNADGAISKDQSSLIASVSFVSAFWLFVAIRSPNNMVVMLGASIVSGDYSNLGVLFAAEILVWSILEIAYFIYGKHDYMRKKQKKLASKAVTQAKTAGNGEYSKELLNKYMNTYNSHVVHPVSIGNNFR